MADGEVTSEELEFAVREYSIATQHLMDTLLKVSDDEVPRSIGDALMHLAHVIDREWA